MNTQIPASVLTKHQVKTYGPKPIKGYGPGALITAKIRHDDNCGNGHNTFSVTADVVTPASKRRGDTEAGGCMHEEIAKSFPELAPFIKWHLTSTDEPLHYVANTVYNAGDRDCHGLRKGEFRQHTSRGQYQANGVEGVPCWELETPESKQTYANEKPASVVLDWKPYGRTGEGKERDLDAARRCAVWPDATDAELMQEPEALRAALVARIPVMMADFKSAVESLGFVY